jgi:hypothetical protein
MMSWPITTQRRRLTAYIKAQLTQVRGDFDSDPDHLNRAKGAMEFAQKIGIIDDVDVQIIAKRIADADVLSRGHNGEKP